MPHLSPLTGRPQPGRGELHEQKGLAVSAVSPYGAGTQKTGQGQWGRGEGVTAVWSVSWGQCCSRGLYACLVLL